MYTQADAWYPKVGPLDFKVIYTITLEIPWEYCRQKTTRMYFKRHQQEGKEVGPWWVS